MPTVDRLPNLAILLIGLIAVIAALEIAETFFAPVMLALVAGVLLSPLAEGAEQRGVPSVIVAVIGLVVTLLVLALLIMAFQPVVSDIVRQAPKVWADVRDTIEAMQSAAKGLMQTVDDVKEALKPEPEPGKVEAVTDPSEAAIPSVQDAIVLAPSIAAQIFLFSGALFFFLLSRRQAYAFTARNLSGDDNNLLSRLRGAERAVSHYLFTISCINAGMGVVVAFVMSWLGVPNPISWGLAAGVLNYVLYLGPASIAVGLLFAGIAQFNGWMSFAPAAAYLAINATEAQFVTPAFVGRNMSLNPLAVFLGLTFGLWLWGPVGGVVAIPLMVWIYEMYRTEPSVEIADATAAGRRTLTAGG